MPSGAPRGCEKRKNYLEQFAFVQGQHQALYSWFFAILVLLKLSFLSKVLSCFQIFRKPCAACCLPKFLQGSCLWSRIPVAIWLKIGGCWDKPGLWWWGKALSVFFFNFVLLVFILGGNAASQHRGIVLRS